MKKNKFLYLALSALVFSIPFQSCKKSDAINEAAKSDKLAGIEVPGIAETKAIAQEAFVYGLPIVMNYAVLQEFIADKKLKGSENPLNQIFNEHRVFTYEDKTVVTPNSDTPYSMLMLDLRAEPIVITVPAIDKSRYYSVQFIDGNTYNYGYIGSRATGIAAGNYLVAGPDWKGTLPKGIKKVFTSTTPFGLTIFSVRSFSTLRICPMWLPFRRAINRSLFPNF